MKSKRLLTVGLLVLAALCTPLAARLGGAGSSASFLTMGGGARPISMGCAYTAMANGPDALYWNPAGIASVKTPSASFGQAILFAGMLEENLGVVFPAGPTGAIGIQALAHLSGPIEVTTIERQNGTGNFYTANNYAIGLSYARQMTDKFTAGITIKAIDLALDQVSAVGWAVDVGAVYNIGINNLRLGFVLQNFGPDMAYKGNTLGFNTKKDTLQKKDIPAEFISEPFRLPFTFAGGLAIDLVEGSPSRLTLEADFVHLGDQSAKGAIGLEYALNEMFFLRTGFGLNTAPNLKSDKDANQASTPDVGLIMREVLSNRNSRGPSAGLGVRIPVSGYKVAVDYSFEWHWYLSPVHRASLGIEF